MAFSTKGCSNIGGSLEPLPEEKRTIVSLDLGRLRKVVSIDAESGLARIQAGAQGPDLEEQLNQQGWTIGHFPDSFTHSTLGGWVATVGSWRDVFAGEAVIMVCLLGVSTIIRDDGHEQLVAGKFPLYT